MQRAALLQPGGSGVDGEQVALGRERKAQF